MFTTFVRNNSFLPGDKYITPLSDRGKMKSKTKEEQAIITVSFTAGGFRANAESDGKERMFKYYKSVLIDSGDTLWSIAVENKTPGTDTEDVVEEIKKINGLHSDGITSGNYLIVPYYSKEFRSST